jgi:DNA-binding NtrC family response regulator/Flp pilus assembly protein TadD
MANVLRGVGSSAPSSELLRRWVEDYRRGHYTAVVDSWTAARPNLATALFVSHPEAVEAVGWSIALTKRWPSYDVLRRDTDDHVKGSTLEPLIRILDSWRAIHEARYDASLVGVRNVQSEILEGTTTRLLSQALKVEGVALFRMGRYEDAESMTRRALVLFRMSGDPLNVAHCATNLGLILNARGEIRAARDALQNAVEALTEAGAAEERLALAYENLAVVEVHLGEIESARAHYDSALETFQRLGLRSEEVTARNGLGQCERVMGRFEAARRHFEAALRMASPDLPRQICLSHEFLDKIHSDVGAVDAAEQHYLEAMEIAASIAPDGDLMVETSWRYAELLAREGRTDECREHVLRAERLCERSADRRELGCVQRAHARLLAAEGAFDEAEVRFEQAIATLESSGRTFEAALTRLIRLETFAEASDLGALDTAVKQLRETFCVCAPNTSWLQRVDALARDSVAIPVQERCGFVTGDPELLALLEDLPMLAESAHAVLIEGESGTGKELVARGLHSLSRRQGGFVAVNCAAIPHDLFESELFGYARGAFSGSVREKPGLLEQAHNGTLLLDEIGEMPAALQAKLLRVLDDGVVRRLGDLRERSVSLKVVAATNRPLRQSIESNRFRRDLYHRLAVHHLMLKPLRERAGDIELLTNHFAGTLELEARLPVTPELLAELEARPWHGNVRELRNELIRRATQRSASLSGAGARTPGWPSVRKRSLRESRSQHERRLIEVTLQSTGGNVTHAARSLGMHVTTLRRKIRTLGVRRPV